MSAVPPIAARPMMQALQGSANIAATGFVFTGRGEGEIWVRFHGGVTWRYWNCTRAEYDRMLASPSVGSFFHAHIRHRKPGVQVS